VNVICLLEAFDRLIIYSQVLVADALE
jgi:hypothetical protein